MKLSVVLRFSVIKCLIFILLPVSAGHALNNNDIRISGLKITGNRVLSDNRIRRVINTESPSLRPWVEKPQFNEQILQIDVMRIRELYNSYGYYDVQVDYELDFDDRERNVDIKFIIDEGDPVILRNLDINIDEEFENLEEEILKNIPLREDEIFSSNKFRETKKIVEDIIASKGYPKADIKSEARVNRRMKWADATFVIDPGDIYEFRDYTIAGNEEISTKVIERGIAFRSGELYSLEKVTKTQRNLFELGLFRSVNIDSNFDEEEKKVDIHIRVTERPTRTVKVGAGFGTEDLLRGQISWTHRNFLGGGRTFNARGKFSFITQRVQTSIKQPHVFDTDIDYTGILNFQRDDLPGYKGNTVSTTNRLNKIIGRNLDTFVAFDLIYARIDSQTTLTPIESSRENIFLTTLNSGIEYIKTDDIFNPTRGFLTSLILETSLTQLGSDVDYVKAVFDIRGYQKLSDIVFAKRIRLGTINSFGSTGDFDVPIFKRFFAGGSATMRGFPFQKLGPLNEDNDPLGGNSLLIGNLEGRFPLYRDFGGVLFLDYGNVFPGSFDFKLNDIKYAVGTGLRYNTIVGPVRLDLGYTLNPEENISRYQVFISIGQAF